MSRVCTQVFDLDTLAAYQSVRTLKEMREELGWDAKLEAIVYFEKRFLGQVRVAMGPATASDAVHRAPVLACLLGNPSIPYSCMHAWQAHMHSYNGVSAMYAATEATATLLALMLA